MSVPSESITPEVNRILSRLDAFSMEDRLEALDFVVTSVALRGLFTQEAVTRGNVYAVLGMLDKVKDRVKNEYDYQLRNQQVPAAGEGVPKKKILDRDWETTL